MTVDLVLTVIGPDRPGLVESLSRLVLFHGANWVESRMSHLSGQFAGILRVEVEEGRAATLEEALRSLESEGLRVVVQHDTSRMTSSSCEGGVLVQLELVGPDRPGMVRSISSALKTLDVNVEELETACESAAMSGERLFRARARLLVPESLAIEALESQLEAVASELMSDVTLAPRPLAGVDDPKSAGRSAG